MAITLHCLDDNTNLFKTEIKSLARKSGAPVSALKSTEKEKYNGMKITISSQDLMKNRPLEPGWYDAKLVQFSTKPSSDKGSTNFIFHVEIAKDQRVMEALFNSKALGMMEKAASVVSGVSSEIDPITNKPKPLEFEPDECIGHEFQVKLDNEPFDGRVVSKIKDWLPKGVVPVLGGFSV